MRYAILLFIVASTAIAAEPPVKVGVIGLDAHALEWAKILRDRGADAPHPELADMTIVAAVAAGSPDIPEKQKPLAEARAIYAPRR